MNLNRFLCLASGTCLAWFVGVAHAQFNNITASPNTLFVNTATYVKFVADVKPDIKLIGTSVHLLRESNGVWSVVGTMWDDGSSGDNVAGDSRFTVISIEQGSSLTTLSFRASAAYSGVMKHVQSSILLLDVVAAPRLDITQAAGKGDLEAVKALIAEGIDANQRIHCNDTPLMAAAKGKHSQIVEALLQAGARVDFRGSCPLPQESVLCMAAEGGSLEAVRLLVQRGAPPNAFDAHGRTPLMCATDVGNLEVMKFLLENGADIHLMESSPNIFPPLINTALMHATEKGLLQATQLLLEHGARVNEKGRADFTALAYAAEGRGFDTRVRTQQDYPGTVRILLKHGAEPNIRVKGQSTPLMLALRGGQNETAKVLLDGGANPNDRSTEGETPLMIAVKLRDLKAVQLLLGKAADLSLKDNQGRTAVQFARMLAFPEIELVLQPHDTTRATSIGSATEKSTKAATPMHRIVKTLWQVTLGDRISGGPWLADDLVIYSTYSGRLIALTAKTGTKVWEAKTGGSYISQPALAEGVLYFGAERHGLPSGGRLLALQLATGKIVWDFPTSTVAYGGPLVRGRAVYVRSGRDSYAIDRSSGKKLWHMQTDSSSTYPPVLSKSTALLGGSSGSLVAVDAKSGHTRWQLFAPSEKLNEAQEFYKATGLKIPYEAVLGMCEMFLDGQTESKIVEAIGAFFGSELTAASFAAARKIVCPPGTTREQVLAAARRAELPTGKETLASLPSAFGDKVFFRAQTGADAGAIYAVELESGRVIMRWPTRFGGGSAPVADDKAVYFMDQHNLMAMAMPSGERLWSLDLQYERAGYDTPLVSVGNYLYVASNQLIKIDRMTGAIEWKMPLSGRLQPGKDLQDGQVCALGGGLAYKADLAAGNVAWTVRQVDIIRAGSTIACGDRVIFYYEDWDDYPAYGVELLEPGSSAN